MMIDSSKLLGLNITKFAPPLVIVNIISKWLELKELARLDTSIANHSFRSTFLFQLYAYQSVRYHIECTKCKSDILLTWIFLKRMRPESLILTNCQMFPKTLSNLCGQMTTLHLEDCKSLTDDILVSLLKKAPLVDLKLSNCELISDATLLALTSDDCAPLQLESLSIGHCAALSDIGLSAFASKHCRVLQSFTASHCDFSSVGIGCVLEIASGTLRKVSCEYCVEVCGVADLLQSFVQFTSLKYCMLEEFSIAHLGQLTVSSAANCLYKWMPPIALMEEALGGPIRLKLHEGAPECEDCQISICYSKGEDVSWSQLHRQGHITSPGGITMTESPRYW
jgi:hypothetical protein